MLMFGKLSDLKLEIGLCGKIVKIMRYYAVRFGLHRKAMSWTSHRYY
jgi:hypothetical protein